MFHEVNLRRYISFLLLATKQIVGELNVRDTQLYSVYPLAKVKDFRIPTHLKKREDT